MTNDIRTESLNLSAVPLDAQDLESRAVLQGEIEGAQTFFNRLQPGRTAAIPALKGEAAIFFFAQGAGAVTLAGRTFGITEMALFIPPYETGFSLQALQTPLVSLEIRWKMLPDDLPALEAKKAQLPYFALYSACKTYKEAIKSPKTVNRTLVPENIIPRFCMGSVETQGPDAVGAHRHPMLEQHFFGLSENDCLVKADAAETRLNGNMLLHIPLGSEHSVRVEEGKKLHYLWLDFFRDAKGVEWITKMHKTDN